MKGIIFGPDFFGKPALPFRSQSRALLTEIANASHVAIYATVESGAGITAGSLATLRPLMRQAAQTIRISINRSAPQSRTSYARKYFRTKSSRTRSETEPFDEESHIMSTMVTAAGRCTTSPGAASNDNIEAVPTASARSEGEGGPGQEPWATEHSATRGQIMKAVDVQVTSTDRWT
jgi:hypothetical protein